MLPLPWLVGTALIHSLSVTEKRGIQRQLDCCSPSLRSRCIWSAPSLVRSGVLVSVHFFRDRSRRAVFISCYLLVLTIAVHDLVCVAGAEAGMYACRVTVSCMSSFCCGTMIQAALVLLGHAAVLVYEPLGVMFPSDAGFRVADVFGPGAAVDVSGHWHVPVRRRKLTVSQADMARRSGAAVGRRPGPGFQGVPSRRGLIGLSLTGSCSPLCWSRCAACARSKP